MKLFCCRLISSASSSLCFCKASASWVRRSSCSDSRARVSASLADRFCNVISVIEPITPLMLLSELNSGCAAYGFLSQRRNNIAFRKVWV
jgi:hypothetical protein